MSSRIYPLKIEVWGEDGEELLSRGHHDPLVFLAAVVRHLRETGDVGYRDTMTREQRREVLTCGRTTCAGFWNDHPEGVTDWLDPVQVRGCQRLQKINHQWRRWLPPRPPTGSEWDDLRYTRIEDGPGVGVFPVTTIDLGG
jgi:hypothetical protein